MPQPRVISKEEMEQCFDGAAATYDRIGPRPFAKWGERLVELLNVREGDRLLDVATGTGAVLLPAARAAGPAGFVAGTDLAPGMVREAAAAARTAGLSSVKVETCDAENLPFDDAAFDAVTCAFSLFMFHDMETALREMRRVCRPGGRIGLTLFSRVPPPFDPGWGIFAQQAMALGAATRVPQRVAYEPDELAAMLAGHGLTSMHLTKETYDVVFPLQEDWWAFQLTLGSRSTILGMDEETRARFKHEHLARLGELWREDGLHTAAGVVYAIATSNP